MTTTLTIQTEVSDDRTIEITLPPDTPAGPVELSLTITPMVEPLSRDDVLQILRQHRQELATTYHVESLALFGSIVRGDATYSSDIDLLVEFSEPVGLFTLVGLQQHLEHLFGRSVDVGTPDSLHPRLRDRILAETVRAY